MVIVLPLSLQQVINATNTEDRESFLAAFGEHALLDDSGREFFGHEQISAWDSAENIGMKSRLTVLGVKQRGDDFVVSMHVTGDGFNGGSSFAVSVDDDGRISRFVIR